MRQSVRVRPKSAIALFVVLLSGCTLPYLGKVVDVPSRKIVVTDASGAPLSNFDLYIYRCTHPGSQFDKVFPYPSQASSQVSLDEHSKITWKRSGYTQLAPDFFVANEPESYWVACVAKPGYQSRRWSLQTRDGAAIVIQLRADGPGPDACVVEKADCNVCRSYEYFMYKEMRYRHAAC